MRLEELGKLFPGMNLSNTWIVNFYRLSVIGCKESSCVPLFHSRRLLSPWRNLQVLCFQQTPCRRREGPPVWEEPKATPCVGQCWWNLRPAPGTPKSSDHAIPYKSNWKGRVSLAPYHSISWTQAARNGKVGYPRDSQKNATRKSWL